MKYMPPSKNKSSSSKSRALSAVGLLGLSTFIFLPAFSYVATENLLSDFVGQSYAISFSEYVGDLQLDVIAISSAYALIIVLMARMFLQKGVDHFSTSEDQLGSSRHEGIRADQVGEYSLRGWAEKLEAPRDPISIIGWFIAFFVLISIVVALVFLLLVPDKSVKGFAVTGEAGGAADALAVIFGVPVAVSGAIVALVIANRTNKLSDQTFKLERRREVGSLAEASVDRAWVYVRALNGLQGPATRLANAWRDQLAMGKGRSDSDRSEVLLAEKDMADALISLSNSVFEISRDPIMRVAFERRMAVSHEEFLRGLPASKLDQSVVSRKHFPFSAIITKLEQDTFMGECANEPELVFEYPNFFPEALTGDYDCNLEARALSADSLYTFEEFTNHVEGQLSVEEKRNDAATSLRIPVKLAEIDQELQKAALRLRYEPESMRKAFALRMALVPGPGPSRKAHREKILERLQSPAHGTKGGSDADVLDCLLEPVSLSVSMEPKIIGVNAGEVHEKNRFSECEYGGKDDFGFALEDEDLLSKILKDYTRNCLNFATQKRLDQRLLSRGTLLISTLANACPASREVAEAAKPLLQDRGIVNEGEEVSDLIVRLLGGWRSSLTFFDSYSDWVCKQAHLLREPSYHIYDLPIPARAGAGEILPIDMLLSEMQQAASSPSSG